MAMVKNSIYRARTRANPKRLLIKENFTGDTAHFIEKRVFSNRYTGEGKNFHLD